jgi:hypothetical protein
MNLARFVRADFATFTSTQMPTTSRSKKARHTTLRGATRRRSKSHGLELPTPKLGPVNEWFELRRSPIQGVGAFAIQDIPKGTRVIEYTGEKITNAEADRRYEEDTMGRHHTFLFILNQRQVVDGAVGGNESIFINHSCDPNCETEISRGKIWIHSLRAIPAGEELTYDYAYDYERGYTEKDLLFYACKCGSPKCRRTIVNTKRLLK